jgi:hypothetical protein
MAVYLLFFVGWVVPHHVCDHTPRELHWLGSFAEQGESHSIHNPELCQLCKTHGQLDLIDGYISVGITTVPPVEWIIESPLLAETLTLSHLSPRAPPIFA